MSKNVDVAVMEEKQVNTAVLNLEKPDFSKISNAKALPIDENGEYWTPTEVGESKKLAFLKIEMAQIPDFNDKSKLIEKLTAFFLEPKTRIDKETGEETQYGQMIQNASARLVSFVAQKELLPGACYEVVYQGRKKNKTNNNMSDSWSFLPLEVEG